MNFNISNISVKNIFILSDIINNSTLIELEFIKSKYQNSASHFEDVLYFLNKLNLISIRKNKIMLKGHYRAYINNIKEKENKEEILQDIIIGVFIKQKNFLSGILNDFFSNFQLINNQYEFKPDNYQKLKYSGIRNLLIDLNFIVFNTHTKKYIISPFYTSNFDKIFQYHTISMPDFVNKLQEKIQLGENAELRVIQYEKEHLSKFPFLASKIEHTAIKNIMAGYDIKSYERKLDNFGNPIPRYIEVKAVSRHDYKFDWTRNEIEKAKFYNDNYYLYLLPVIHKNDFDFENLKVIQNPYLNVYIKADKWLKSEEVLSFIFKSN